METDIDKSWVLGLIDFDPALVGIAPTLTYQKRVMITVNGLLTVTAK